MTSRQEFNPLLFQLTLAAGGISLMPFNFLQFALPSGKGLITLSDIVTGNLSDLQSLIMYPLISIMLVFVILHFGFTMKFLKGFTTWKLEKEGYNDLMRDPYTNERIFAVLCSLGMSANVFWASAGFFIPQVSSNIQALMAPSLVYFCILWLALMTWEFRAAKLWMTNSIDLKRFNFTWLLDILAFGIVSLTGTGIASMAVNHQIASVAAFLSIFSIVVGIVVLMFKLVCLFSVNLRSDKMPSEGMLPAYFLLIPLACLFGLSGYRLTVYVQKSLSIDMGGMLFFFVNASYIVAIAWGLFCIYLLKDYLKNDFIRSKFAPPQWAMV